MDQMFIKLQHICIFFLFISNGYCMDNIIRNIGNFYFKPKTRLDGSYSFTKILTPTLYQCAQFCYSLQRCRSFNYNTKNYKCHLNALSYKDVWWDLQKNNYLYMDREDIPKGIAGACAESVCHKDEICIDKSGQPLCYPFFEGQKCPANVLPAYVDTDVKSEAVIGQVAILLCKKPLRGNHSAVCKDSGIWSRQNPKCFPDTCDSVSIMEPNYVSGVKVVSTLDVGFSIISVYCDADTDGGNWMVIQRRLDISFNFNRTWEAYEEGFGDPVGNFWIGNKYLYQLTVRDKMVLRIEFRVQGNATTFYGKYNSFNISAVSDGYVFHVNDFIGGNCGNGLSTRTGMKFSTWDKNTKSCSLLSGSGWWHNENCSGTNLNAKFGTNYLRWTCDSNTACMPNIEYTAMMIRKQA